MWHMLGWITLVLVGQLLPWTKVRGIVIMFRNMIMMAPFDFDTAQWVDRPYITFSTVRLVETLAPVAQSIPSGTMVECFLANFASFFF